MMATVPHVTSGLGLRKFQADEFLLTRVYILGFLKLFIVPADLTFRKWAHHSKLRELQHKLT